MKKLLLFCFLILAAGSANAQCVASLSGAQAATGNNLLNVNFTNSSYYGLPFSGQMKSFNIDYGDISGLTNYIGTSVPSHNYSSPGTYTVGFRIRSYDSATNTTICTDSTTISVTVSYPPCGSTITVGGTGATKTFTANTPAGTTGMSYAWNYGDGNTGSGSPVSHTYTATGTYTVTLVATAGSGPTACTYTNTTSVFIYIPPPPLNCSLLKANFNASVSGNIATFTNTSNVASGVYQTLGSWDFGDGTTGTGYTTPPHTYTATGVYTVKLVMNWKDSLNTTSCKDSTTKTISITSVPAPTNLISGNVVYDTSYGLTFFKVYLIKYDSVTNWLSAIDSVVTGNTASPYYAFGNKPAGSYRTKAAAWNGISFGTGYIPSYHDSSVYWNTAKVIAHAGASTLNKRIYVSHGTSTTGVGFIGGNVSFGANKGASSGVPNLLIYLRDANMKVISMTYTDANGDYSFPNIAYSPYSVWPERMNYSTMPVTPIVLNTTRPSWNDVDFSLDDTKHSIVPVSSLGIAGTSSVSSEFVNITPVPATDNITITWKSVSNGNTQFTITNITGEVVGRTAVIDGKAGSVSLNIGNLSQGVYFVHGSGSLASKVARMVVQ
jgi:PKD repeat protein